MRTAERIAAVEDPLHRLDAKVDERARIVDKWHEELRKHVDDLHKETRTMSMDLRETIKLSYDSLNRRMTRLEQGRKRPDKRRRH